MGSQPASEPYQYLELPKDDSIRLLSLEPGVGPNELHGSLVVYRLCEAPKYEALSYVWGALTVQDHVKCDGNDLPVTSNLRAALRRLRLRSTHRLLWVDQLCIDQNNIQERSRQVNMMMSIYKAAATVLVWLGQDYDREAENANSLITTINSLVPSDGSEEIIERIMHFPSDKNLQEYGLPPRDHAQWGALIHMTGLRYFTRVWVIQEVGVASQVLMMWGEVEFELNSFRAALSWASLNNCFFSTEDSKPGLDPAPFTIVNRPSGSLLQLLTRTDSCQATDPRDKVFALRGLVDEPSGKSISLPEADYTKSVVQVYCETTKYIIRHTQALDVLCYSVNPNLSSDGYPSWMPRFDQGKMDPWRLFEEHEACGNTTARIYGGADKRLLVLEGIRIDTVNNAEITLEESEPFPGTIGDAWDICMRNLGESKPIGPLLKDFIFVLTGGTSIDDLSAPVPATDSLLSDFVDYQISRILQTLQSSSEKPPTKCLRHMLDMAQIAASLHFKAVGGSAVGQKCFSLEERQSVMNSLTRYHPGDDSAAKERHIDLIEGLWIDNDWRRFSISFANAGECRRFLTTEQSTMGIGPPTMQSGDIICILFGGRTPFVLRPCLNRPHYLFVGECYVHGSMRGEAINLWKQGKFKAEHFTLE